MYELYPLNTATPSVGLALTQGSQVRYIIEPEFRKGVTAPGRRDAAEEMDQEVGTRPGA